MNSDIIIESKNELLTVTLNRENKRNALSLSMLETLSLLDYSNCKVIYLKSNSTNRTFCAGADLNDVANNKDIYFRKYAETIATLQAIKIPIVCGINGSVFAGGLGLLAVSDIVFAQNDIKLGLPEVKIGLIPAVVTGVLSGKLNYRTLSYMALTGENISANDAYLAGFITAICTLEEFVKVTDSCINGLLKIEKNTLIRAKEVLSSVALAKSDSSLLYNLADKGTLLAGR
jgi:enoyl-CoA hydratase/carnithine racemase